MTTKWNVSTADYIKFSQKTGAEKNIQNKSTKYVRFHKFRLNIFAQMFIILLMKTETV